MNFASSLAPASPGVPKGRRGFPCGRCDTEGTHWDIRGWRCELHTPWASWEHPPEIGQEIDDQPWLKRPGYLTKRWKLLDSRDMPGERSGHVPQYPGQGRRTRGPGGRNRWDS